MTIFRGKLKKLSYRQILGLAGGLTGLVILAFWLYTSQLRPVNEPPCSELARQVASRPLAAMRIGSVDPPTVESVELLTEQELSKRSGGSVPGPASAQTFCYITVRGEFTVGSPLANRSKVVNKAYQVYNATTGQLMETGERQ